MFCDTLNIMAIKLARTPDAEMNITERLLIEQSLTDIAARRKTLEKLSSHAAELALLAGVAMWGGRIAELRATTAPPPRAEPTLRPNGPQRVPDMPQEMPPDMASQWPEQPNGWDTSEALQQLQGIRIG